MRPFVIFFILVFIAISGSTKASIGRFLPFSGFYPIPRETPEPINVNTFLTYPLLTFKPLTLSGNNEHEAAFIRNTGFSVQVFLKNSSTTVTATGGPLYGNLYRFRKIIFYWANNANGTAYTTVNGKNGSPLEVAVVYVNLKYGPLTNAMRYRDGVSTVLFRIQIGSEPNPKFDQIAAAMKKIQKAGPLVPIKLHDVFKLFNEFPTNTRYFAYPGSLVSDETTGEQFYCTTTIPVATHPTQFISKKQFDDTFLKLLKYDGTQLINQKPQYPRGLRPVARSRGIVQPYSNLTVYHATSTDPE
ncbi:putative carbonic anhydrase-like protein 1 isoform X1 [Planococcus citri]|uniref:putative carbonic anhydrase-like protein 1 isoform X1 n=1 Tax=Planococcus citri TaxID=170843 RepID=UPI0031F9C227